MYGRNQLLVPERRNEICSRDVTVYGWLYCWAGALVAGLATQAFATPVAPDRPTGLTADLDNGGGGGVFLSWDARTRRWTRGRCCARSVPRRQPHTVIATVDGELNEWTDTDLTAGDRRYKVAAVRDSLTSRRSRVAKLMLDEPPPPLRPTPSTITQVPEKELATEKAEGDTCNPEDSVDITPGTAKGLSNGQNWVKVTLTANVRYQIYYDFSGESSTGTVRSISYADRTKRRLETREQTQAQDWAARMRRSTSGRRRRASTT